MKVQYLFFFLIIMLCLLTMAGYTQSEYYVSPNGNDRNIGSKEKPFKTIQRAHIAVRKNLANTQKGDISVWLNGSTYYLTESLKFGLEDSISGDFQIFYKAVEGEKPVISGGVKITGWKKKDKGLWVAQVPDIIKPGFRELFVDGKRATRARHPNSGYLHVASVGTDRRTNFNFNTGDFPIPDNPQQVEMVVLHDWSISRIQVDEIDYSQLKITAVDSIGAKCLSFFNLDHWEKNPRYFLENSKAFLDSPDEWFFDSLNGLLFLALSEDETPDNSEIIVPVAGPHLLEIVGTEQKKVKNIAFEGVTFQYCSWMLPEKGYAGIQACHFDPRPAKSEWAVVPAAVNLKWAENCSFIGCNFLHLGGSGLWFGTGSVNCKVSGSGFEDISGNGVMVGEGSDRIVNGGLWWKTAPGQVASGNSVTENVIADCGKQFFGAVGIWCGLTAGTQVRKNQVFNLPYTGISIGWEWSPVPTPCRNNQLTGNHIHHVVGILSDGGGIYMLGLQPESVIADNLIHDVKINAGRAESNGMFLDEGTTEVTITGNIIYNIARSPLRFHKANSNLVENNILSCGEGIPPVRYNSTPETNIRMENNRLLQDSDLAHRKYLEAAVEKLIKDK